MVPVHRATAIDYRRPGKPTHPCIVGAGLAPALPRCTRSFIRQQRPLWSPAAPCSPPFPMLHLRMSMFASQNSNEVPPEKRSEEHTSELQSHLNLVCRLLLEKKKKNNIRYLIAVS